MQKLLSLILLTVLPLVANAAPPKPQPATYQSILPVLRSRCIVCHSESNLSNTLVSGGLALDSFGAIIRGSATSKGPRSIVIPRKSIDSEIVKRLLATSPSKMMPKGGPPLSPAQIALFQKWIDAGATAGVATKSSGMVMNKAAMPKLANIQLVTIPTLMNGGSKDQPISLSMQIGPLPIMTSLSFSPDGKFIAVAGYRAVTLWDTTTGMPTCITNLPGSLMSLAYSPDGSTIAVTGGEVGGNGEIVLISTKDFARRTFKEHTDSVLSVTWSSDGKRIATGSQDKTARIWDVASAKSLFTLKDHSEAVNGVCFSPDGKYLYTASQDHSVRRFDAIKGELIKSYTQHQQGVNAVVVKPDGSASISVSSEVEIRWWDFESETAFRQSYGHTDSVNSIRYSYDGKRLITASSDKTVRLWDENGSQLKTLEGSTDWLYSAALSPNNHFAAACGADGFVRIWNADSGRLILTMASWPGSSDGPALEWFSSTPEGYYQGNPGWLAKLKLTSTGSAIPAGSEKALLQPEMIFKALKGETLVLPKLPSQGSPTPVSKIVKQTEPKH